MRRPAVWVAVLGACLLTAACAPPSANDAPSGDSSARIPSAPSAPANDTLRIAVLGDSNSSEDYRMYGEGPAWPELMRVNLAARIPTRTIELENAAQPGWTSRDLLAAVNRSSLAPSPDVVIVMIGTNDPGNEIPLEETISNVRAIVGRVSAAPSATGTAPLVIVAQPPVAQSGRVAQTSRVYPMWCPYDATEYAPNNLRDMKDALGRLAQELDVRLVPVWDRFAALGYDGTQPERSEFVLDGLHLARAGQVRVARWMAEEVAAQR